MKVRESDWNKYRKKQSRIVQKAMDEMAKIPTPAESIAGNFGEAAEARQWVAFRLGERNGKTTKVPVNPLTGWNARTNDPGTWGSLEEAQAALSRFGCDGVGFVFAGDYFGIDLDHVIDPESGTIAAWAQEIIDTMGSYAEVSPSGRGVHIICRGDPALLSNKNGGLEIYCPTRNADGSISGGRYFTVTGNALGEPLPIAERTKEAETVWKRFVDGKPVLPADMIPLEAGSYYDDAYSIASKYAEASAALSAEMYDALAEAQGKAVPPAVPAEPASFSETSKAVQGTLSNKQNMVEATVGRLVKQAGADTMLQNAKRDGAEFAWIPRGDTCAFCLMLASNGWQYQSKNAMKNGHASHIHANCDCNYVVRFDGKSTVEGYDPDEYLAMYENAEGATWKEKLNSMRREQYAEDRDRINAQKRAAYARKRSNFAKDPLQDDGLSSKENRGIMPAGTTAWPGVRKRMPMRRGEPCGT